MSSGPPQQGDNIADNIPFFRVFFYSVVFFANAKDGQRDGRGQNRGLADHLPGILSGKLMINCKHVKEAASFFYAYKRITLPTGTHWRVLRPCRLFAMECRKEESVSPWKESTGWICTRDFERSFWTRAVHFKRIIYYLSPRGHTLSFSDSPTPVLSSNDPTGLAVHKSIDHRPTAAWRWNQNQSIKSIAVAHQNVGEDRIGSDAKNTHIHTHFQNRSIRHAKYAMMMGREQKRTPGWARFKAAPMRVCLLAVTVL